MLLAHASGVTSVVDCSYASRLPRENFPETLLEIEGDRGKPAARRRVPAERACGRRDPRDRRGAAAAALGGAALAQHPGERPRHRAALRRVPAARGGSRRPPVRTTSRRWRSSMLPTTRRRTAAGRSRWGSTRDERRGGAWSSSTAPRCRRSAGRTLAAGPLSAALEAGNLRYLDLRRDRDPAGGLVRGARPRLGDLCAGDRRSRGERGAGRLHGQLRSAVCRGPSLLRYRARIEGRADGSLRFEAEAVPEGDFETNRCGFVVLHPAAAAGAAATIEHVDGSREATAFPELIDPWRPFVAIREITHRAGGLDVHLPARGRGIRDGGPAQLVRRLVQDLRPAAGAALALRAAGGGAGRAVGDGVGAAASASRAAAGAADRAVAVEIGAPTGVRFPEVGLVVTAAEVPAALARARPAEGGRAAAHPLRLRPDDRRRAGRARGLRAAAGRLPGGLRSGMRRRREPAISARSSQAWRAGSRTRACGSPPWRSARRWTGSRRRRGARGRSARRSRRSTQRRGRPFRGRRSGAGCSATSPS